MGEMTATASSISPINRRDLINTILELPESEFWDLVDLRLNRPKGFRRSANALREYYIEIIYANGKPSIVERWTEERIIDELFLQLATTKNLVLHRELRYNRLVNRLYHI